MKFRLGATMVCKGYVVSLLISLVIRLSAALLFGGRSEIIALFPESFWGKR